MSTPAPQILAHRLAPHQGDWLRKSLEVSGVSAIEMATVIDVSRRTMTNYLAGRTTPRERMIKEWSIRTGVPAEYLKTGAINGNGPASEETGPECTPWDSNPEPIDLRPGNLTFADFGAHPSDELFVATAGSDGMSAHHQEHPMGARRLNRPVVTLHRDGQVA